MVYFMVLSATETMQCWTVG